MVDKKRKSKRITTRKREKISTKVRQKDSKVRRIGRKSTKRQRVPSSIYQTSEEAESMEQIKQNAAIRNKQYELSKKYEGSKNANKKDMSLSELVNTVDMVIEMIDCRDIFGSTSQELNEVTNLLEKRHLKVYSNTENITNLGEDVLTPDFVKLKPIFDSFSVDKISILVAGNKNLGIKKISEDFSTYQTYKFEHVVTDTERSLSSVLRGVHNVTNYDYLDLSGKLFEVLAQNNLANDFDVSVYTAEKYLLKVGEENKIYLKNKSVDTLKTAKFIFNDVKTRNIFYIDANGILVVIPK